MFLVFINPFSGRGNSQNHYADIVEPILSKHDIKVWVVETDRANHANKFVQTVNLAEYTAILIVSGDGLVFECTTLYQFWVLNGLIQREDWREALQFPIGVIPTGSGNGLVASIFHANGVSFKPGHQLVRDATLSIPSALPQTISLFHVETDTGQHLIGFLSLSWGLLADIDIESEKYRRLLGSSRFTAGGVECAIKMRTYRGKVSYLPYLGGRTMDSNPATQPTKNSLDLIDVESRLLTGRFNFDDKNCTKNIPQLLERGQQRQNDCTELLSPWVVEETEWTAVVAVTLTHMCADVYWCPSADCRPENPLLHLVLIRKNEMGNRAQMIRWMIDLTPDARHAAYPFFHVIPVLAVRIEPATDASPLVVDGEVVRCGKIQATATTHTARILAPTK